MSDTELFTCLRETDAVVELVSSVEAFECSLDELANDEVRERDDGSWLVFLRGDKSDTEYYLARGVVTPAEGEGYTVEEVWIQHAIIHGPLAGRGTRWQFEDNEIIEREWIS